MNLADIQLFDDTGVIGLSVCLDGWVWGLHTHMHTHHTVSFHINVLLVFSVISHFFVHLHTHPFSCSRFLFLAFLLAHSYTQTQSSIGTSSDWFAGMEHVPLRVKEGK